MEEVPNLLLIAGLRKGEREGKGRVQ